MQLINSPAPEKFPAIEISLHPQRLMRYMPAAGKDKNKALRYYLWNSALCESFHLSLHVAEIACRNTLHKGLEKRLYENWYLDKTFLGILDPNFRSELNDAILVEAQQHGQKCTVLDIVSQLSFAFWEHLATKRFERFLWSKGLQNVFPCAPKKATRDELHGLIESVRRWRNRIAHHRAIFDKGPVRKHQDALDLISWCCVDTGAWVGVESKVPTALKLRPT